MFKRIIITLCTLAVLSTPAVARVDLNLNIDIAPPPSQVEVVSAPRPGYVWAPGYWAWQGGRYIWVAGHGVPVRRGYYWVGEEVEVINFHNATSPWSVCRGHAHTLLPMITVASAGVYRPSTPVALEAERPR